MSALAPFSSLGIDRVVRAGRGAALLDLILGKGDADAAFRHRADLPPQLRELFVTAYNEQIAELRGHQALGEIGTVLS